MTKFSDEENSENSTYELNKKSFLIDIAINQVKSRCKKMTFTKENFTTLNMVCACMVNLWINTASASNEPTGTFRANGYCVNKNSKHQIQFAKKMFDQWRSAAAPLLIDEGFAFFTQKELIKK